MCSLSIASVAICTAVWKPKHTSVSAMSLSIVFGTPTIGMPTSWFKCDATHNEPLPPMTINASTPMSARFCLTCAGPSGKSYGLPRRVPRIVPPRGKMPASRATVSSVERFSSTPSHASRNPTTESPKSLIALRVTARITAFRPGQSPPPVSTPILIWRD